MANRLKMATVTSILTLHYRGWSNRQIAEALGVHRNTVNGYIRRLSNDPKCASNPPPGSNCATNPPPGSLPGPVSCCEPYREIIEVKLAQGLNGKRIHQDLVTEHGFSHGYDSVKRFIRGMARDRDLPFRRMEVLPGKEAQVDLGGGAAVIDASGRRRKTYVFRVVLSHSRKAYSEAVQRQDTETLIRCLENAFRHFGGVPETIVLDNAKAFVKNPDWYDPELNPKLRAFAEHYGTVILPTRPYTPRHKGKIERGIGYVQDNALKGRSFSSLADQNRHLLEWETSVADTRIHGTTRKQVGKVFEQTERPALLELPAGTFPLFNESQRTVHRDGHVEVSRAYYSVPPEYTGRRVWARWDGRIVRIYNKDMKQLAVHLQQEPGRFSTHDKHIHSRKFSKVERGAEWLVNRTIMIGPNAGRWARQTLDQRGVEALRVLVGLQSLTGNYDHDQIDRACEIALNHGVFRLRPIRTLLKRGCCDRQGNFEFMDHHEIIREISSYDQVLQKADSRRHDACGVIGACGSAATEPAVTETSNAQ